MCKSCISIIGKTKYQLRYGRYFREMFFSVSIFSAVDTKDIARPFTFTALSDVREKKQQGKNVSTEQLLKVSVSKPNQNKNSPRLINYEVITLWVCRACFILGSLHFLINNSFMLTIP